MVGGQDVRSLREAVEPTLLRLDEEAFGSLKATWSEASRLVDEGLKSVISRKVRAKGAEVCVRGGGVRWERGQQGGVCAGRRSEVRRGCGSSFVVHPLLFPPCLHTQACAHAPMQGVTMLATLDSRRLALEIAGKWRDEEAWGEAVREVRAKVSAAVQTQRAQVREGAGGRGGGGGEGSGSGRGFDLKA